MENSDDWGCVYDVFKCSEADKIYVALITVQELDLLTIKLIEQVNDGSWMLKLDSGTRKSYNKTVAETAEILVDILNNEQKSQELSEALGEIIVSLGAGRVLEIEFQHKALPLAELWKPQKRQNEGFDFHTECTNNLVHFGEAKYSGSSNPYTKALDQIAFFLSEEKHFRDRVHLINLVDEISIENLDNDNFGSIAAFSINSDNPNLILKNAIAKALNKEEIIEISKAIYIVGVICKQ